MEQGGYDIFLIFLDKYGKFTIAASFLYFIINTITFFNTSNIERMLEDSKTKIFRNMLDEFVIFFFTITFSGMILEKIKPINIGINIIMLLFVGLLLPFSGIVRIGLENVSMGKVYKSRLNNIITFSRKNTSWLKLINFILVFTWLQMIFLELAYEFNLELKLANLGTLDILIETAIKDYRIIYIYAFFILVFYAGYRFIAHPSFLGFYNYTNQKLSFTIILD